MTNISIRRLPSGTHSNDLSSRFTIDSAGNLLAQYNVHAHHGGYSTLRVPTHLTITDLSLELAASLTKGMAADLGGHSEGDPLVDHHVTAVLYVDGSRKRYRLSNSQEREWFSQAVSRARQQSLLGNFWFARLEMGQGTHSCAVTLDKTPLSNGAGISVTWPNRPWTATAVELAMRYHRKPGTLEKLNVAGFVATLNSIARKTFSAPVPTTPFPEGDLAGIS